MQTGASLRGVPGLSPLALQVLGKDFLLINNFHKAFALGVTT